MQLKDTSKFANIEDSVILKLRERYVSLHPLLFLRSVERAESIAELFDILDTVPEFPLTWCEKQRRWVTMANLLSNN